MKFTQLFTKTQRQAPKTETATSAQLLTRAGFIFKNMAGVYSLLPLGVRVMKKIERILCQEMDAIGGQQVYLNIMQDPQLWRKTGRWVQAKPVMYQWQDETGKEHGLGFTHEEVVAQIATQFIHSYTDLPKYVYQIQTKFRREPRAQAGLLRGREFGMKDLYSLTASDEQLNEFYEVAAVAYQKIFNRLGLATIRTLASGGLFSKRSDEFQVIAQVGEDTVYVCPDRHMAINKEIISQEGKQCFECKKALLEKRAIEVGNIFKLGTRFSQPLGLHYTDKDGNRKPVVMGSYGIGTGRAMAAVVEVHHDDNGIIWPVELAPFLVHLVEIRPRLPAGRNPRSEIRNIAKDLYQRLTEQGIDVLYDDRDAVSAGEKLADADLIGCPLRVVVSSRHRNQLELKQRSESKTILASENELTRRLRHAAA